MSNGLKKKPRIKYDVHVGGESESKVSHERRPDGMGPAHVVVKVARGLPKLRFPDTLEVIEDCVEDSHKDGFEILEYTILDTHIHLLVEACSKGSLSRGMQGFNIRLAKALNKLWKREGTVIPERYWSRFITTVAEYYRVLRYILHNARNHGIWIPDGRPDDFSSARWHRWEELGDRPEPPGNPTKRGGPCSLTYVVRNRRLSIFDLPGRRAFRRAGSI